jgi:sugar lactone lactonase YvrE
MLDCDLVVDSRCGIGESPVWDPVRERLWWVDIRSKSLWTYEPGSGCARNWQLEQSAGCVALACTDILSSYGGLVAAMEDGVALITPQEDGAVSSQWLSKVAHPRRDMRFNDGRCDRQGRFLAGTMVCDMHLGEPLGKVYRMAGQGRYLQTVQGGLIVPNGMAFSPDGKIMYLSDSHPNVQTVWAFDYDVESGVISDQRLFIDFRSLPGRPDGAAVDEMGCYWICGNDAGLVHRFKPDGRLDRSIAVPVKKPAMCAFGGANLDTLFVTSIRPAGDVSDQPLAGGVFAVRPGVRGLPETPCLF